MFNNLKLRNRILWGYSVPVLLSIGVTIVVYVSILKVEEQLTLVETSHEIDRKIKDIAYNINAMQKTARGYVIAKNPTYLTSYNNAKEDFSEELAKLKSLLQDPTEQQELSNIFALSEEVDRFNTQLISLVDARKRDQAVELWKAGKGQELSEQLDKLVANLEERDQEILRDRQKVVADYLRQLNITVVLSSLLSFVLAIAIGLWIASVISKRINQTASQVASSSTEIAATVEQQERTVSQQAASVNQTTITMDELGASSRQSAEQAEASAKGARQALTLAEEGTVSVQQTMEGMSTLKEKVGAIAEQIVLLGEQTDQIRSISELVGDLAYKTNMLAINAAVEASRAGEQGKGFGVVAAEIRKLADQSKKSAEKINALVTDIQDAINTTVMVTDEGTKKVDEGINLAQGTQETFTGVADSINNVFLNSQQIYLSAKQQAIALQQVVDAMNSINLGAKESASGISQVKGSTQQLNEAAHKLKAVV